jgi:hypothetical protein
MKYLGRHSFLLTNLLAAGFALCVIAPVTWLVLDRMPAYSISYLHIDPPSAVQGQSLRLEWGFTVLRSGCSGRFYRVLTDHSTRQYLFDALNDGFVNQALGPHEILGANPLILPPEMLPGRASLTVNIQTWCTVFQQFRPVTFSATVYFDVLPKG